jgi:transcriptional regulator with XRE-family HTH domain
MTPIASAALTSRLQAGHRIAVARRAAKLTQPELAAQCGVTPARLSKLERGFSKPRPEELDALERVLPATQRADATDTTTHGCAVGG